MSRSRRRAIALALLLAVPGASGSADARPLESTPDFWGVVPVSPPSTRQVAVVAHGGVSALRAPLNWSRVQRSPASVDWSAFDAVLLPAAEHDVQVLPFVLSTPEWVAHSPAVQPLDGTAQRQAWANFLAAAVGRYGPGGSFWAEHPELRPQPIRRWQIWNEPNLPQFADPPSPRRYAALLRLSRRAIRSVDPGAEILLAGLYASRSKPAAGALRARTFLQRLYRQGARGSFDGVALHPYSSSFRSVAPVVEGARRAMTRNRDGDMPIWITEIGWSSLARGQPLARGPAGQARELEGAFAQLWDNRLAWRLAGVYWFSLTDSVHPLACVFCVGSGLFTADLRAKPAWRRFAGFVRRHRCVDRPSVQGPR